MMFVDGVVPAALKSHRRFFPPGSIPQQHAYLQPRGTQNRISEVPNDIRERRVRYTRRSMDVQIAGAGVVAHADKDLARKGDRMLAHVRAYHLDQPPEAPLGHTCCSMEPAPIAWQY